MRDDLDDMLQPAARVHATDMALVLALHFSDTRADPGHQEEFGARKALSLVFLQDSVRACVERVMLALKAQGTTPTIVQVGNGIASGMLWSDGRVKGSFEKDAQRIKSAASPRVSAEGVRTGAGSETSIMIHMDRGGSPNGAQWSLDHLTDENVPFDSIGLSCHPSWHGPVDQLDATPALVTRRYEKPGLIAETAYPWTLQWFDDRNNNFGLPEHVLPNFPATADGRARSVARPGIAPLGVQAAGFCGREPAYVAAPGFGPSRESLALFDNTGEVLPGAVTQGGLHRTGRSKELEPERAATIFPNPVQDGLNARLPEALEGCVQMAVCNPPGQMVKLHPVSCIRSGAATRMHLSGLRRDVCLYVLSNEDRDLAIRGTFVSAN